MQKELEEQLNDEKNSKLISLKGKISLNVCKSNSFTIGKVCVKGIITITRADIIIDGKDAEIEVKVDDCTTSDWSLFFVHPMARNVQFRNMRIRVWILNSTHSNRTFSLIYNTAYGVKLHNCQIEVFSDKQLNIVGVYNNGNLDTHMETRADNLVIENCQIKVDCRPEEYPKECSVYGVFNNLANSISVQNTFIYSTNRGDGSSQKAVGIYSNGRFGRFVGNNIKANALHNVGREIEQAHAFGFINEGMYSIITSNNIVGEWAGMSVGLENRGEYTIVSSNKILATHTICGRSIRSYGNNSSFENNVLTSTSRNARLIEHNAHNCVIGRNIMEVLMAQSECRSGCAIYAVGDNCAENIIRENIIRNVSDCAIFADASVGIVGENIIASYPETHKRAGSENIYLKDKLDERHIQSI